MDTIGQLRYRIKFAVPLTGREGDYGGPEKTTWIFSEELFAGREFRRVGSDEQESAAQKTAIQSVIFIVRGREGIDTSMQIILQQEIYRIVSISKTQRTDYLEIETEHLGMWDDQSLVQPDGQSLTDSEGNALLWAPVSGQDEGYSPPGLKFRDSDGNLYERK